MNLKIRFTFLLVALLFTAGVIIILSRSDYSRGGNYELRKPVHTSTVGSHESSTDARKVACTPTTSKENCDVIHLALVVGGYSTSRTVVTMMKSILFYRHNPLHFHFIVDSTARQILSRLMDTWQLPAINCSYYSSDVLQKRVSWIPNAHYSGVYGLMKLLLPSLLKSSTVQVNELIVLDTDVTLVSDVADLWKFFQLMKREAKAIGLVENQSNWYLGTIWKNHKPWPALGTGFNTGVMLMRTTALNNRNWDGLWQETTHNALKTYHSTALADQDIINAVIKNYPDLIYVLPCSWNVQLSEHTLSEGCYTDIEGYNIIHWNSPKKQLVSNKHAFHFRNLHYTFLQYNGNLLQTNLLRCYKNQTTHTTSKPIKTFHQLCSDFTQEAEIVHRVHLYYFGEKYINKDQFDTTLVAQLSWDRVQILDSLVKQWEGPMSIAVYATDYEVWQLSQFMEDSMLLHNRPNIAVHVVYKQGQLYPINVLRNVALSAVSTPFMYLSDIDFLPMLNLYTYLKEAVKMLLAASPKRALVVPAFETFQYKLSYPKDKVTLLKQLKDNKVHIFRHSVWKKGHHATNYDKWTRALYPYKVKWSPDFEPYIVVHRNVTKYNEKFVGFGWNKVSHIMELDAQGYEFIVLPEAFTIHMPHTPSLDITRYRTHHHYRKCLQLLKADFVQKLVLNFGPAAQKYVQ